MDEFDMSNLDSFDFEAAEKSAKKNSDKKAATNLTKGTKKFATVETYILDWFTLRLDLTIL